MTQPRTRAQMWERARAYGLRVHDSPFDETRFRVSSHSVTGLWHHCHYERGSYSCDCPDFQYRHVGCVHLAAVDAHLHMSAETRATERVSA